MVFKRSFCVQVRPFYDLKRTYLVLKRTKKTKLSPNIRKMRVFKSCCPFVGLICPLYAPFCPRKDARGRRLVKFVVVMRVSGVESISNFDGILLQIL